MSPRAAIVAVLQMNSTADVEKNVSAAEHLAKEASGQGAELIVLPENFAYLGPDEKRPGIAERLPEGGPILRRFAQLARELSCELVLGGFLEKATNPKKTRNSCVHLGVDGKIISVYRKIHLFDVDLPDGTGMRESESVEPGSEVVVSPAAFGGLGLSVCYDVRFPELYRMLVDKGAVALAIPSAFTEITGMDHWHVLLRARAIESQSYVLAAAQVGHHYDRRKSFGHALIVDPWGAIIAECSGLEGIAIADVNPEKVSRVREQMPKFSHRKLRGGVSAF